MSCLAFLIGLIPTHAGKTPLDRYSPGISGAHPHSRGENVVCFFVPSGVQGSSPLTRGKRDRRRERRLTRRLIPTHAGKTKTAPLANPNQRAHPHSRGENFMCSAGLPRMNGSSPLTRGKLYSYTTEVARVRLIPTHAGKTGFIVNGESDHWAHPHSRGENALDFSANHTLGGSSPLTRGKL